MGLWAVRFTGICLLATIIGVLLFGEFFSAGLTNAVVTSISEDGIVWFLVLLILIGFLLALMHTQFDKAKEEIKNAIKRITKPQEIEEKVGWEEIVVCLFALLLSIPLAFLGGLYTYLSLADIQNQMGNLIGHGVVIVLAIISYLIKRTGIFEK